MSSEGRNKFSELVANAAKGGPQVITKRGKEVAVILSVKEYRRLKAKERPFTSLLDNPLRKIHP
ncbi:MAG: type II toxin-antitoxin system Phd/YefM family antitoxin [Chloracidobacterium sp.]|nr:type II toxin-antitoxin system Phd/YefM family antitoxin [Chloracidobacterium sp.]